MSNYDRVLSDEVDDIFDVLIDKIATRRITDKDFDTAKKITLDLINTQKRLYAESVIGEDEHVNMEPGEMSMRLAIRDVLRAEQRARIK